LAEKPNLAADRFCQNEPNLTADGNLAERTQRPRRLSRPKTERGNPTGGAQDTRTYGIATSANYRVSPDTLLGLALAGGGTGLSLANGLGSGSADLFQAGARARQNIGAVSTERTLVYDVLAARAKPADCWPYSR
jgi:hypothetical protein